MDEYEDYFDERIDDQENCRPAIVWLVTYEGQKESVYTYCYHHECDAEEGMRTLQRMYPGREWRICEKDVS